MTRYITTGLMCCFFILHLGTLQAQQASLDSLQRKLISCEFVYFKVLSKHYENNVLTTQDTLIYVKSGNYSYQRLGKTECLIQDGHTIMVDNNNRMLALGINRYSQNKQMDILPTVAGFDQWEYNQEENYYYLINNNSFAEMETKVFFNQKSQISKIVFTTRKEESTTKDILKYLVFCTDKECISTQELPTLSNFVYKNNNSLWKATSKYKNYDLSINQ